MLLKTEAGPAWDRDVDIRSVFAHRLGQPNFLNGREGGVLLSQISGHGL